MNLKKFLNPDWKKIVLTVILSIWLFLGFSRSIDERTWNPLLSIIGRTGFILLLPFFIVFLIISRSIEKMIGIGFIINFIVLIGIYSYFLSCFIMLIYDYFKPKLKKEKYKLDRQKKFVEKKSIPFKIKLDIGTLLFIGIIIGWSLWEITTNRIKSNWPIYLIVLFLGILITLLFFPFIHWIRERVKKR